MPRVDYLLLCESYAKDVNRQYSLINIFDKIIVKELPFNIKNICVAFSVIASEKEYKDIDEVTIKIVFKNPDGHDMMTIKGKGVREDKKDDPDKRLSITSAVKLDDFVTISKYGTYTYSLYINDVLLETKSLEIFEGKK